MRIFEVSLLIISSILPFYISTESYRVNKKISLAIVVGVLILHLGLEGYRWQLFPAYLVIVILLWCLYKTYLFFKGGLIRKIISVIGLVLILVPGWILPFIFPVLKLPKPTGEYIVGSQYIHLKTNIDEIITSEVGDSRELMVKVWYPAILNNENKESYLNKEDRTSFATKYGLPKSVFNYLDYVTTHTYANPTVARGKFPVLIFSHGLYSKASGYYALIEEIVSHGYIVLNINHTYESTGTLFPDGDIKFFDVAYDLKQNTKEMADMVWIATQDYNKATNWNERHKAVENAIKRYVAANITNRWVKDFSLVIDELENWNASTFLADHMDISKVGVFGHSQGGAAAGQSLLDNEKIKAGINIDGMQWGKMIDCTLNKPFALISSDWSVSHPNWNDHAYHNGSTSDFYQAKVFNSGHSNFMDIPLMINLKLVNEAGSINPYRANEITTKMILQFFDKYLMDKPSDLLELSNTYSDFKIKFHKKKRQVN